MNDTQKARILDGLLSRLAENESLAADAVARGVLQAKASRQAAFLDLLELSQLAITLGHRTRSLELLAEALMDLDRTGSVAAILAAPSPVGKRRSAPSAAMFKGCVAAAIDRLLEIEPATTVKQAIVWAQEEILVARANGRIEGLGAPTVSAVRGWHERFRSGGDDRSAMSVEAFREELALLRSSPRAPGDRGALGAHLQTLARALPLKPK